MSELKKIKRKGEKKKKIKSGSKRSFRLGLKGKLLLYFLLMALIPAIGLTVYSTTQMMSSFESDRLAQLQATGDQKAGLIETWFEERQGDAAFIADLPTIEESMWTLINASSSTQDVTDAAAAAEQVMGYMIEFYGCYLEIFLVDGDGTVKSHAEVAEVNGEAYEASYEILTEGAMADQMFVDLMDEDSGNWGDPEFKFLSDFNLVDGEVHLLAGCPLRYEGAGESQGSGMIIMLINLETINNLMHDTLGLGTSGETYIVDHEGLWLTTSKFDYYTTETGEYENIHEILLTEEVTTAGIVECIAEEEQIIKGSNNDYRGTPVMGVYYWIDINSEGQGWVIVTEMDVSEALAQPLALQQISIIIMVVVAGIVAVVAFVIARQIANPVKELSDLSETIAGGNYEVEVNIKAQDEVEDLVGNFRVMKENVLNALKYSENLISGLPVSVLAVDNDFNIEKLNPTLESLLGIKAVDLIGKKCYDVFRYDICNTENCQVRKAWKLNGITDSEDIKTINRGDQSEMELRISSSPIKDGDGNTTGGIEVSLDVTLENQMTREVELAAEQISASVEELSSSAEEVSASSENIASTQQQLSKGSAEQVMGITETQRKFGDLSKGIRTIREKVENIGQVADLIKGIASQTNMLALNAAIEAARAGEAGRGFNVVADQVRKLADESRNAVANTEEMLAEIDVISKQQEGGALEILKAIDSIATIAEESSSSTEEAASAAEEQASSMESITSSAQTLMSIVQKLEALIEASVKSKGGSRNSATITNVIEESDSEKKQLENELITDLNDRESAF